SARRVYEKAQGALGPTFAVMSGRRTTGAVENSSAPTSFVPDRGCPSRSMVTSGNDPTAVLMAGLVDCSLNTPKESSASSVLTRRAPLLGIAPFATARKTIFPALAAPAALWVLAGGDTTLRAADNNPIQIGREGGVVSESDGVASGPQWNRYGCADRNRETGATQRQLQSRAPINADRE